MEHEPTIDFVEGIRGAVGKYTRRTPLLRSGWLSKLSGSDVFLKCENLQVTGSFKVRGAVAALSLLPADTRARGVVACSAGNHGLGLAFAAHAFHAPCTIAVPRSAPAVKQDGIRALGANVITSPHDGYDRTQAWMLDRLDALGGTFVSPFEDAAVIAGNGGTTMLEVLEEAPPFDVVVVPCGGGGCAIGTGVVAKSRSPMTRVVAVNTDASAGMWMSRRDERAHLTVDSKPTIADGLEGGISEITFGLGKRFIDDVVLAKESTIRQAVPQIAFNERLIVEGSGAAGVAAVLDGRIRGKRVCIFLTGGNIDRRLFASLGKEGANDA
ncbi:MAG: pyridoxal-phosphate dependent enzyme [Phycisphaerales bacterium]|nr:MAG: pyridoxal-phosphate dependent enzyme [Phycisphaerales bacterium]